MTTEEEVAEAFNSLEATIQRDTDRVLAALTQLDQIAKDTNDNILRVLKIIYDDPHVWGKRPCNTCLTASTLLGQSFGCERLKETDSRRWDGRG